MTSYYVFNVFLPTASILSRSIQMEGIADKEITAYQTQKHSPLHFINICHIPFPFYPHKELFHTLIAVLSAISPIGPCVRFNWTIEEIIITTYRARVTRFACKQTLDSLVTQTEHPRVRVYENEQSFDFVPTVLGNRMPTVLWVAVVSAGAYRVVLISVGRKEEVGYNAIILKL